MTTDEPNDRHGYSQPTLAQYETLAARLRTWERVAAHAQSRIEELIVFRNSLLDAPDSPWRGSEVMAELDRILTRPAVSGAGL